MVSRRLDEKFAKNSQSVRPLLHNTHTHTHIPFTYIGSLSFHHERSPRIIFLSRIRRRKTGGGGEGWKGRGGGGE